MRIAHAEFMLRSAKTPEDKEFWSKIIAFNGRLSPSQKKAEIAKRYQYTQMRDQVEMQQQNV